jgi:hypothetical protein
MLATLLGIAVTALLVFFLVGDWVRHPGDVDEAAGGASARPVRPAPQHRRGSD